MVWLSPELSTRAAWVGGRLAYSDGAEAGLAAVLA
jgi:hypothetical protein